MYSNKVWIVGGKSGYLYYCDKNTDKAYKSQINVNGEVKSLKVRENKVWVGTKDGQVKYYSMDVSM